MRKLVAARRFNSDILAMRRTHMAVGALIAAVTLTGCALLDDDASRDPGLAIDVGHFAGDPTFFPSRAQFAVSDDGKTIYLAGRAPVGSDSSIFAFDLGSRKLTAIVPKVVGLVRIVAVAGDDILFSLASGEIRRAGRNRVGSDPTVVVDGRGPFVISDNGRFIAHRLTGTNSEVIDLTTGARRTALTENAEVTAVRNDGEELVYMPCCRDAWVVNLSTGVKRRLTTLNAESFFASAAWVGDTLRLLVLASGRETRNNADYIVPPTVREIDVDYGTTRDLGTGHVGLVAWVPRLHKAGSVAWYMCKQDGSSTAPCISHGHNLFSIVGGEAREIGRVRTYRHITTALMTSDGSRLIYYGDQLMVKQLD